MKKNIKINNKNVSVEKFLKSNMSIDELSKVSGKNKAFLRNWINNYLNYIYTRKNYDHIYLKLSLIIGPILFLILISIIVWGLRTPSIQKSVHSIDNDLLRAFAPVLLFLVIIMLTYLSFALPMFFSKKKHKNILETKVDNYKKILVSKELNVDPNGMISMSADEKENGAISLKSDSSNGQVSIEE